MFYCIYKTGVCRDHQMYRLEYVALIPFKITEISCVITKKKLMVTLSIKLTGVLGNCTPCAMLFRQRFVLCFSERISKQAITFDFYEIFYHVCA